MQVVVPPVLVEGTICRVVMSAHAVYETQEWTGTDWLPSGTMLTTVRGAVRATRADLAAFGVPEADAAMAPDRVLWRADDVALVALLADTASGNLRPPVRAPASARLPGGGSVPCVSA